MSHGYELTGKVYGKFTCIGVDEVKSKIKPGRKYWILQCSCGNHESKATPDILRATTLYACRECLQLSKHGNNPKRLNDLIKKRDQYQKRKLERALTATPPGGTFNALVHLNQLYSNPVPSAEQSLESKQDD